MTAQINDVLMLDGERHNMTHYPYLPQEHPEIKPNEASFVDPIISLSTACYRRYVATWEIKNDKLYLAKIMGRFTLNDGNSILADWFTGKISIPKGKILRLGPMFNIYEQQIIFEVEQGRIINRRIIDN